MKNKECEIFEKWIDIDTELTADETSALKGHLQHCAHCQMISVSRQLLKDRLQDARSLARTPEVPAFVLDNIMGSIEKHNKKVSRRFDWTAWLPKSYFRLVCAGVSMVLLVAFVWEVALPSTDRTQDLYVNVTGHVKLSTSSFRSAVIRYQEKSSPKLLSCYSPLRNKAQRLACLKSQLK